MKYVKLKKIIVIVIIIIIIIIILGMEISPSVI